ncbi:MAG: ATP-binding protein [Caldisericia bacterium]
MNGKIFVVGESSQYEVYIASREERFSLRDYFFVKDEKEYLGEVVESFTMNRFYPRPDFGNEKDERMINHLKILGFEVEEEDINIGRLKLIDEPPYPIKTGSEVRRAKFDEIKNILKIKEEGLNLGGIKNSERFFNELPNSLKNLYYITQDGRDYIQNEIPFIFSINEMSEYPHIGIFGGSGSGKSFLIRVLIEEIAKQNYPAVVFDPHFEMDFSLSDKKLPGYSNKIENNIKVFNIGENIGIDFSELNYGEVDNLFKSIGEIEIPQEDVIYNAYYSMGKEKSLSKFRDILKEMSEKSDTESEKSIISRSSARAVLRKLNHLVRLNIFGKSDREILKWIEDKNIGVSWGNLETIKVFASFFLDKLVEKRRSFKDGQKKGEITSYFPPFFVIIDEAHNFAPKDSPYLIPSKRILKTISQEGRKYGIFLILSTQRPSLLDDTILAQLSTKFIFRTVRETDLRTISNETDLSKNDIDRLPYLKTGDAFISSAIYQRSIPIRIRKAYTIPPHTKNPFEELKEGLDIKKSALLKYLEDEGVIESIHFGEIVIDLEKNGIRFNDENELLNLLDDLTKSGEILKEDNGIYFIYRLKDVH